jgi:hypothetical protein
MSRTPETIDRLVKYIENIKPRNKQVTIKPMGAFKECKHFYAIFDPDSGGSAALVVRCYNINNHYDATGIPLYYKNLTNKDNLRECVVECLDILDNITFSVADGGFHKNDVKLPGTEFKEIMNELWNIEEEVVCCVCQEKTISETRCGHKLCILCWSTINETKPRCPMCRSKIYYLEEEQLTDSESDIED